MPTPLLYPPTQNGLQKQLNAQLNTGVVASLTLNNTTGIQDKPGVCVVNRIDVSGNVLASSGREYILYTGVSGNTLTGLTRAIGGSTDQDHAIGQVVEFIPDVTWAQMIADALANLVDPSTLAIDTTKIVTPTATQTLTNKTLTSPSVSSPTVTGTPVLNADSAIPFYNDNMSRQAIMNGNFDVWQRGTSFTLSGVTSQFVADRWAVSQTGDGITSQVVSRQSTGAPAKSQYYLEDKQSWTSGDGGNSRLVTFLEAEVGTKFAGQQMTLSFQYKIPTSYTNQWNVFVRYDTDDSTLNSAALSSTQAESLGTELLAAQALTNTTSWTTVTKTLTVPSTAKRIMIGLSSLANTVNGATFHLAQVQLCAGEVALPFQPKSIDDELRACRRFCYRITPGVIYGRYFMGQCYSTTTATLLIPFPVKMRTTPTFTYGGTIGLNNSSSAAILNLTSVADSASTSEVGAINATVASGLTAGQATFLSNNNDANGYVQFEAEL